MAAISDKISPDLKPDSCRPTTIEDLARAAGRTPRRVRDRPDADLAGRGRLSRTDLLAWAAVGRVRGFRADRCAARRGCGRERWRGAEGGRGAPAGRPAAGAAAADQGRDRGAACQPAA